MEKSTVYFTDLRTRPGYNLLDKLNRLMTAAGFDEMEWEGRFAAIKIHFGEPGNLSFIRPNYAKAVADHIRSLGGKPFLTDCNTLYVGRRKDALEHMDAAYENGFSPFSTGCQIIIADGLKGTDEAEVPVKNGVYVKNAKIGRAIMDADVVVSLNHFKGHEATGFGGALKNLGMGSGSRAGKMEQHMNGKPEVNPEKCRVCHACQRICAQSAIDFETGKAHIDHDRCVGCGRCLGACNFDAIENENWSANDDLCCRIAEYAKAVVQDRPAFHINLVMDVSPNCDCHSENDAPIIPDVGIFASFDPVAVDQASADACNRMTPVRDSQLGEHLAEGSGHGHDHFCDTSLGTDWTVCLDHAEKIGLGSREYELKVIR